jgi:hypothetical protein
MPVKKHYAASPEELNSVVSSGKMVIVNMETARLWNDSRFMDTGHSVVVTGAELDRDGRVLGYYINDTGRRPPDRARFVTAGQFMDSWGHAGQDFVEPL